MKFFKSINGMTRINKFILGGLVLLFLYTVVGFFALPPVFKRILQSSLAKKFNRPVTIENVAINPYALAITVNGFRMEQKNGTGVFLSVNKLYVNLQAISLFRWAYIVKQLKITEPDLNLIRRKNYQYNFADLLQKKKSGGNSLGYSINNIQIVNGSVHFQDRVKNEQVEMEEVDLGIPFISDLNYYEDIWVKPSFAAKINGSRFSFKGKSKPYASSRDTMMDVVIKELDISQILEYTPVALQFKMSSGKLSTSVNVNFSTGDKGGPSLEVSGDMSLTGVKITDIRGERLLAFPKMHISINSLRPLDKNIHLSEVVLQSPDMQFWRENSGTINLTSIIGTGNVGNSGTGNAGSQGKGTAHSFSLDIDKISIKDGHLSFSDYSTSKPFHTSWGSLDLAVDHFSNAKNAQSAVSLSAKSEHDEVLGISGEISFEPLVFNGSLDFRGISASTYAPYYEDFIQFNLSGGTGELKSDFSLAPSDHQLRFSNMSASINSLQFRLNNESEEFLNIPVLTAKVNLVDLENKRIAVDELRSSKGTLILKRLQNGQFNLGNLFQENPSGQESTERKNSPSRKPWQVSLDLGMLQNYTVKAEDLTKSNPVAVKAERVNLSIKNISPGAKTKSTMSLTFNLGNKGTASLDGTLNIQPISADLKLKLETVNIGPLQSYIPEVLNLRLTGGVVSADGKLAAGFSPDNNLAFAYSGNFSIDNFDSINTINRNEFVRWDTLKLADIEFKNRPVQLRIADVHLQNFHMPIRITPQGNFNIVEILRKKRAGSGSTSGVKKNEGGTATKTQGTTTRASRQSNSAQQGESPSQSKAGLHSFKFGKIHFQDGSIDFSDKHIRPNFQMKLLDVTGDVTGLVFDETSMANVDLQARLEQTSPLKIIGKINPLKPYVDLEINFDNISMTQLNPYFRKYVGYNLEKGKLSLKLKYILNKMKLDSQNNIVIDKLSFGNRVNSPSATDLPIQFALSLLQNRDGVINLNISVSGDLNNPQFSIGSIISAEIRGLIAKAVSSPFSFLASIVGSGSEELSYVEFAYGSPKIDIKAGKKLKDLALALYKRPNLELDIAGYVDPQKDREALKEELLNKRLKRMKLREMVKHGISISLDQVTLSNDEYRKYLEKAYAEQSSGAKSKENSSRQSMESMKSEILAGIKISDNDLRLLARSRALSVQNVILRAEKIDPNRIFILQPNNLTPPKQNHLKESRAEMSLR
ncbi:MAG: DUF748 domain-containing protein [Desulfoferrobacter sp.]